MSTLPKSSTSPADKNEKPVNAKDTDDPHAKQLYNNPDWIVFHRHDFNNLISNTFLDAWYRGRFEDPLYTVYDFIQVITTLVIKPSNYPYASLISTPQHVFYPSSGPDLPTQPGQSAEAQAQAPAGTEPAAHKEESSRGATTRGDPMKTEAIDKKRTPDFARTIVSRKLPHTFVQTKNKQIYENNKVVDWMELKPLNCPDWLSDKGKAASQKVMEASMEQVYDQAMSFFAHNPKATTAIGFLVVGCYFTQLEWVRELSSAQQPADNDGTADSSSPRTRPPVTPTPLDASLASHLSASNTEDLLKRQHEHVQSFESRIMPKVYYFNELTIEFTESSNPQCGAPCTLSQKYIEALARVFRVKGMAGSVSVQPSWISGDAGKEEIVESVPIADKTKLMKEWLVAKKIEEAKGVIASIKDDKGNTTDKKPAIPPTPKSDDRRKDRSYSGPRPDEDSVLPRAGSGRARLQAVARNARPELVQDYKKRTGPKPKATPEASKEEHDEQGKLVQVVSEQRQQKKRLPKGQESCALPGVQERPDEEEEDGTGGTGGGISAAV